MFHPHYVTLLVGSNDVDDLDTYKKHIWFTTIDASERRKRAIKAMNEWIEALTPFIDDFLVELDNRIPGCSVKYVPIFP